MSTENGTDSQKPGVLPYVVAWMSFIPLAGLLFGFVAIIWGLSNRKRGAKWIAAIGAGGIAFTLVLYGSLFYFAFARRGGIFDGLRTQLAQQTVNSLVPWIEVYKLEYGHYPKSLAVLQDSMLRYGFVSAFDPSANILQGKLPLFFYKRVGDDHYYLRGVGPDGKPFTRDDIVPQIPLPPGNKLGLLIKAPTNSHIEPSANSRKLRHSLSTTRR